jgi:5-aminolevulinate synthase
MVNLSRFISLNIRMIKPKTQDAIASSLEKLKTEGNYRVFTDILRQRGDFPRAVYYGKYNIKQITNWCSNDYLGMGQHKVVLDAMHTALDTAGAGAGGTRNISGTTHYHIALEHELAKLHDKTSALTFTSGYVANQATLSVLGRMIPNAHYISDRHNHNSMIVGIKSTKIPRTVWDHNDLKQLKEILNGLDDKCQPIIALEGVYSMDGDRGLVADVCELARKYGAMVYVDEVHAVGLYGKRGAGVAEEQQCVDGVDVIQGTLAKAFGVQGGYIAAGRDLVDMVRSYADGFIFSTSMSPVLCAGALASVKYVQDHPGLREKIMAVAYNTREHLKAAGLEINPLSENGHIVPVMIRDAVKCKAISDWLLDEKGIYVQPINYPTVPWGTERLRFTPTPNHTEADIDYLARSLKEAFNVINNQN